MVVLHKKKTYPQSKAVQFHNGIILTCIPISEWPSLVLVILHNKLANDKQISQNNNNTTAIAGVPWLLNLIYLFCSNFSDSSIPKDQNTLEAQFFFF